MISIGTSGQYASVSEDTRALGFSRSLGQTFVVPSPTSERMLTDFSFFVQSGSSPADVDLQAFVYEFDTTATSPTGSALFSSLPFAVDADGELAFNGLSLVLDITKTYIAFLSTSDLQDEDNNSARIAGNITNPYAGGDAFRYTGVDTTQAAFTGDPTNWNPVSSDWDMQFSATFAAVPEPHTLAFFSLGLGLLAWRIRRLRT
ncbi:MAG: PEP-CTERM sorting domain-containing protein [Kiritimatiellae bacterium]|nr:PEP-CTERM sorting domain-containing protein [Kiritimatiellia bacterium]